jgi:hypothetical protein
MKEYYMTIAELGSLGEFIGSIAVFVTLMYLALQVRQSNISSRVQSNQAINKKTSDFLKALYTNNEAFNVWVQGRSSFKELNKTDAFKFEMIMYDAFGNFHEQWYQSHSGVTDEIQFARVLSMIRMYMSLRGVVEAWEHMNRNYPFDKKFVEFMQEQIHWANKERSNKSQNAAQD